MESPLRVRYQTIEFGDTDIHLCTLRDRHQFSDPDGIAAKLGICSAAWPIFGVIWPSSLVLANCMLDHATEGKRILEVGCGMALSSLMLNKQQRDITATDNHPEVGTFLARNTSLNGDDPIAYERTDWSDDDDSLGLFDLIIGSDLLYEDQHIRQLADFIDNHAQPTCEVIVVDPGRGRKNKMRQRMEQLGYHSEQNSPSHTDYLDTPFKGHILRYWRDEPAEAVG
ncbi:methyltransferase [Pseudomaricurvus sp. HS19]|uniref:class I SAM-dependent methyltransferase n=1 Tax=Pseudomaricurvus sp. HS19 TaxID=2692626 RepID=UPI0013712200|nr:histidine kinase [Pseudomaricurvus sp. HS19]MYM64878.1 histidine kinase [Pseudomaricurvus sp. HS19]